MQIGNEPGLSAQADGANSVITIPSGPHGTASLRWWALANNQETTGVHPAPTGPLVIPVAIEQLDTILALYLDDHQAALCAIGGDFADPTPPKRPGPDGTTSTRPTP